MAENQNNLNIGQQPGPNISVGGDPPITLFAVRRKLWWYPVTENELENLQEAGTYKAVHLGLFNLCVGIFAALLIALYTSPPKDIFVYEAFVSICFICFIAAVFFGVMASVNWFKARRIFQNIRKKGTEAMIE